MLKTKLILVIGVPGARMDFVAGWLSLLPNFVNMNWGVDPVTGQSYGDMRFAKMLDYGESFDKIWPKQFQLSANADLYITGTGHGHRNNLNNLQDKIANESVKPIIIDTSGPDINTKKLKWEFIVKTYLSQNKISYHQAFKKNAWLIDALINNSPEQIDNKDRIATVDELLRNPIGNAFSTSIHCAGAINLDYNQVFQPSGSQYLCDQLGITVNDRYHQHWNYVLPLSDSPYALTVWGHDWQYKDYFTD
jgi:hypothetical protein